MLKGTVRAGKVDCQAHYDMCQRAGVKSYPTVRFYPYLGTTRVSVSLTAYLWLALAHTLVYTHTHTNLHGLSSYSYTPLLHSETKEESTSTARTPTWFLTSSSRDSSSSANRRNPNSRYKPDCHHQYPCLHPTSSSVTKTFTCTHWNHSTGQSEQNFQGKSWDNNKNLNTHRLKS